MTSKKCCCKPKVILLNNSVIREVGPQGASGIGFQGIAGVGFQGTEGIGFQGAAGIGFQGEIGITGFQGLTGGITPTITFRASSVVVFEIPTGGIGVVLPFEVEEFDVGGGYDPATSLYTVPVTGYYHFDSIIPVTLSVGDPLVTAALIRSPSQILGFARFNIASTSTNIVTLTIATDVLLTAGDVLFIRITANIPGNIVDGRRKFNAHLYALA